MKAIVAVKTTTAAKQTVAVAMSALAPTVVAAMIVAVAMIAAMRVTIVVMTAVALAMADAEMVFAMLVEVVAAGCVAERWVAILIRLAIPSNTISIQVHRPVRLGILTTPSVVHATSCETIHRQSDRIDLTNHRVA